jgi:hypothetical protein
MSGGIYLLQSNGQLVKMDQQPYGSQDLLKRLLEYHTRLRGARSKLRTAGAEHRGEQRQSRGGDLTP